MVEGLPGTGKTTIAQEISGYVSSHIQTNLYCEGALHPADLGWCACMPLVVLEGIIDRYGQYEKQIRENMLAYNGYAVVAYVQFPIADQELYRLFESYEVYDNKVGLDLFSGLHFELWF